MTLAAVRVWRLEFVWDLEFCQDVRPTLEHSAIDAFAPLEYNA
jgi:hypothetical protein